jgi:hypothetical protein
MVKEPDVIVDTCCLINLAAAGDLAWLLPLSGLTWHLPRHVEAQGVAIRMSPDPTDARRQPVDLDAAVSAGLLQRCDVSNANLELFFELAAAHADDADAAALTIALSRGVLLATDDYPLARLARARGVQTLTTAAVLRRVAPATNLPREEVAAMLSRVEQLGRWSPRKDDPDAQWWRETLGRG